MNRLLLMGNSSTSNPVGLRALPTRTNLLAQRVGLQLTYAFLKAHWFETLYIPPNLDYSNLDKRVGKTVALALIELWPKQHFTPPKPDKLLQKWRDHEIGASELSTKELCKKYNITRQRLSQIRKALKEPNTRQQQFENLTLDLEP